MAGNRARGGWLLALALLVVLAADGYAQDAAALDQLWQDVGRACEEEDYEALARASAQFINGAPQDDERLPEAWFRYADACRALLREVGEGPYDFVLCHIVKHLHDDHPDSEWTLKAYELLAEEGARRAVLNDHLHPFWGGFWRDALDRLMQDTSRAGILRLGEYAYNWLLTHRASCDVGRDYREDAPRMLSFVGRVLDHVLYSFPAGTPRDVLAAGRYAAARTLHAYGSSRAGGMYADLTRGPYPFYGGGVYRLARAQLDAGVSDPLPPGRPGGEWASGGHPWERIEEVLGDIPAPGKE